MSDEQKYSRENVFALLSATEHLPTLPEIFLRIQTVLKDPRSGANDIAQVIGTDQSTTALILRVANSPSYNPFNRPVTSVPAAVARLGSTETGQIAMTISLLHGFHLPASIQTIRRFWNHAYAVGLICRFLSSQLPVNLQTPSPDTMFVAGLMHDIGKAIFGIRIDEDYFELIELCQKDDDALLTQEREKYGTDHIEVGTYVLKQWGLPDDIVKIVEEHHEDQCSLAGKLCHLADHLANEHIAKIDRIEDIIEAMKGELGDIAGEALENLLHPGKAISA